MHHKNTILFCSIAIALLCSCSSHAAPEISEISGALASGNTLMIKGSGFGTKSTAPPLRYDNFENGVAGENIMSTETASEGWFCPTGFVGHSGQDALSFSNEQWRYPGTQSAKQEYIIDKGPGLILSNSKIPGMIPPTKELYVSGWFWFKMWDGLSINTKFINFGCEDVIKTDDTGIETLSGWQSRVDGYPASSSVNNSHLYAYLSDGCTQKRSDGTAPKANFQTPFNNLFRPDEAWHRVETYLRIGTNGYRDYYIDSVKIGNVQGAFTSDNCSIGYLLIGHYFKSDRGIDDPKAVRYWDELYVDVTRARVEIGDASDFNSSSHREIQIPITWNDKYLEITLNKGSFDTLEDKYLFVIDADNNPSGGFPLGDVTSKLSLPSIATKPTIVKDFSVIH
ncbi:hypothetical protein GMJAKD_15445 [Candidatus Electrothrix aarhusensis]